MPTKDEVRGFLEKHAPGKPEITELSDNFWMEWDDDVSVSIYFQDEKFIGIRNSMTERDLDEALEFSTLYLSVVAFAHKLREFMTTP